MMARMQAIVEVLDFEMVGAVPNLLTIRCLHEQRASLHVCEEKTFHEE